MKILSKGYRIPEIDDTDFWESYNYDIQRLNDHTHDGTNSQHLAPGAFNPYVLTILQADWVGPGPYTFDFNFPLAWDLLWLDEQPCPVLFTARTWDPTLNALPTPPPIGDIVYLQNERLPTGLGVRFTSSILLDVVIGVT